MRRLANLRHGRRLAPATLRVGAKRLDPLERPAGLVLDELALLPEAIHFQFQVRHVGQQELDVGDRGRRWLRGVQHAIRPLPKGTTWQRSAGGSALSEGSRAAPSWER